MRNLWSVMTSVVLAGAMLLTGLELTLSSTLAEDNQSATPPGLVAAVTHVDKTACPTDAASILEARRQVKTPAPQVIDLGNGYRLTRWPVLPSTASQDTSNQDAGTQQEVSHELVLLEKDNRCQLLVSDHAVTVSALHLPLIGAAPPQLLITSYTGGAHCCFSYDIVTLGDDVAIDFIDSADSPISLVGLGDGDIPDITYADMAFAYWNASFAASPAGEVRLTWDKDRYHPIDPKERPAPSAAVIAAWQTEMTVAIKAIPATYVSIADQNNGKPGPQLDSVIWSHLIDLIYAGYPEMAVDLLNHAWPADIKGKDVFWKDFVQQLHDNSVLWQAWDLGKVLKPNLPVAP